jgi:hypothetical protein
MKPCFCLALIAAALAGGPSARAQSARPVTAVSRCRAGLAGTE